MKIDFTGRRVDLKDAFCEKGEKRAAKLEKFFSDKAMAHITVTVDKSAQTVEATIRDGSFVVRAERSATKMENALDAVFDVITTQIIRNKKHLEKKLHAQAFEDYSHEDEQDDFDIVREKRFPVKPCTVDEAILEMNLLGHAFYMFTNADTGKVELCYRRKDGGYGVLIPELD